MSVNCASLLSGALDLHAVLAGLYRVVRVPTADDQVWMSVVVPVLNQRFASVVPGTR